MQWADNLPYRVILNNSARYYDEKIKEHDEKTITNNKEFNRNMIFISHRSTEKSIADMLVDFLSAVGFPRDIIFCSSLPGNDINEKISTEVRDVLKVSKINIVILSKGYYESAYCLNEAGVLWFRDDVPVIPIALPEINSTNMYGFLNNEYKLRRLDVDTDVSYIYDAMKGKVTPSDVKLSVISSEIQKLKDRYQTFLNLRKEQPSPIKDSSKDFVNEITTDDEKIVLYYILQKKIRKISKSDVSNWLNENEIHNVNIDNAFDLLSCFVGGILSNDTLEFSVEAFRKYSAKSAEIIGQLEICINEHTNLATVYFAKIWDDNLFDYKCKLFMAYIIDEKVSSFGARWMADGEIDNIKKWEDKYSLDSELSRNYVSCLELFVQNDFVYESDWTSYGNPRGYTLYPSLKNLLFNSPTKYIEEINKVKNEHYYDLPF